ncbi:MAG TPA: metallopeptidase TldD-related protein [Candidatus Acidoferrales bacterium]|nr:metallopeptidase TldD-related protein [Candidatus Acidoferrales bacterium]
MSLDADLLQTLLTEAIGAGDYADAFFERKVTRSFRFQEGRIHEAGVSVTLGIGIRVLRGEQAGYAYSDDLSPEALRKTARIASLIARNGGGGAHAVALPRQPLAAASVYTSDSAELRPGSGTYVDLLSRADAAARAFDPRIASVNAFISDELQEVAVATSEGRYVTDCRPLVTLGVQCVARGLVRGNGYVGDGGRTSLDYYLKRTPEDLAQEAARIACINAEAVEAPAGEMAVVVGSGGGGVLLHEAVGHGLEGDFNRQGTSLYSGRIGERVASELVTIYDDGDLVGERGSVAIDDEGTPGQHKVLVEHGVLQGYMQDHLNASLMGMASTGSGRRQSFRVAPQPRMCNTYMPAGESTVEEIIGSVQRGIYAKSFAGGQVDITKGDFVFMVAEGYLIEEGKVTAPIRGATLVGNGPDIMTRVVAVGNDPHLANRHYTCGKGGQYVPVGVGMPTVKIAGVTVGGSAVG